MLSYLHVSGPAGGAWCLRGFVLEVKPGEAVHVTGASGAGKSLLVAMALGETAPASGTVMVNGMNPYRMTAGARQGLRRVISSVRDIEPVLDLTADAWVGLGIKAAGSRDWPHAVLQARQELEDAGLSAFAGTRLSRLPRGTRYALALVRALARKPHLLLLDWTGDDAASVPHPLRDRLAEFVTAGGALLAAGEPGRNALPAGGRVEPLAPGAGE